MYPNCGIFPYKTLTQDKSRIQSIYFQFDGFDSETYRLLRGEPDILEEKIRALDRLASIGCPVILVPAIERGVNEHEI